MRLAALEEVLFDEFPSDEMVKYCIFTKPKFPDRDYTKYAQSVVYCGNETTLSVMTCFNKLSIKRVTVLSQKRTIFKCSTPFRIRAIPTGHISGSVMLLIEINDTIKLYTGQFTECRSILLSPIVSYYKNKINDIYVDNTMAALKVPNLCHQACEQIKEIVKYSECSFFTNSKYVGYTIYLHMEVFGYEDLLYKLARSNIRIQLNIMQSVLFEHLQYSSLFKFDGNPQIKVYAFLREEKPFEVLEYRKFFETKKILHVKLVMSRHQFREPEKIKGLIFIPYTPHAGAYELSNLIQVIQPKRVHPLVKASYADDPISKIPNDVLCNGCEIVTDGLNDSDCKIDDTSQMSNDNSLHEESKRSFLALSDEFADGFSVDVSDIVFDMVGSNDSQTRESENEDSNDVNNRNKNSHNSFNAAKSIAEEVISLEDDGEDDDLFEMIITPDKNKSGNVQQQFAGTSNKNRNKTEGNNIMEIDMHKQQYEEIPGKILNASENESQISAQNTPAEKANILPQNHNPHEKIVSQKNRHGHTSSDKSHANPLVASEIEQNTTKIHDSNDANNNDNENVLRQESDNIPINHRNETSKIADKSHTVKMPLPNIQCGKNMKRKPTPISPQRFHRIQRIEYLPDSDEEIDNDKQSKKKTSKKIDKESMPLVRYKLPPKKNTTQSTVCANKKDQVCESRSQNDTQKNAGGTEDHVKNVIVTDMHASTEFHTFSRVSDKPMQCDVVQNADNIDTNPNHELSRHAMNEMCDSDSDSSDAYIVFPN